MKCTCQDDHVPSNSDSIHKGHYFLNGRCVNCNCTYEFFDIFKYSCKSPGKLEVDNELADMYNHYFVDYKCTNCNCYYSSFIVNKNYCELSNIYKNISDHLLALINSKKVEEIFSKKDWFGKLIPNKNNEIIERILNSYEYDHILHLITEIEDQNYLLYLYGLTNDPAIQRKILWTIDDENIISTYLKDYTDPFLTNRLINLVLTRITAKLNSESPFNKLLIKGIWNTYNENPLKGISPIFENMTVFSSSNLFRFIAENNEDIIIRIVAARALCDNVYYQTVLNKQIDSLNSKHTEAVKLYEKIYSSSNFSRNEMDIMVEDFTLEWFSQNHLLNVLKNNEYKPKSAMQEVHFAIFKRQGKWILDQWKNIACEVLLFDLISNNLKRMMNSLTTMIGLGIEVSFLIKLLDQYGTVDMAEIYLNAGHPEMSKAAQDWAFKRGYTIKQGNGNCPVRWGHL